MGAFIDEGESVAGKRVVESAFTLLNVILQDYFAESIWNLLQDSNQDPTKPFSVLKNLFRIERFLPDPSEPFSVLEISIRIEGFFFLDPKKPLLIFENSFRIEGFFSGP